MANTGGAAPSDSASTAATPSIPTPSAENKPEQRPSIQQEQKPSEHQGFSAATLMLINRVRGQVAPTPLNASSVGGPAAPPDIEDVRRRLLEGMKTSENMTLPALPRSAKRNTGVQFPGPVKSRGGTPVTGQPKGGYTPVMATGSQTWALHNSQVTPGAGTPSAAPRAKVSVKSGSAKKGQKRKRVKEEEESETGEESGEMSDLGGDSESEGSDDMMAFPAMTQSGRMVVKPAQFNPASSEAPPRKKSTAHRRLGKNAEQALCKRCGRGHSPASNMIVFCDGCNTPYHQMCHDPVVSDEAVQDEGKAWFCNDCHPKRSKSNTPHTALPAKTSPVPDVTISSNWVGKSLEEKRTHLSSMPREHLVSLLLQAVAMYPDIPIFPMTVASQLPTQNYVQSSSQPQTHIQSHSEHQPQTRAQTQPQSQSPPPSQSQTRPQSQPPQLQQYQQHVQQVPPRRTNVYPQQPFPPSATSTSGLFSRAEANPSAPINFIRKIQANGGSALVTPFTTSFSHSPTTSTIIPNPVASPSRLFQPASSAPPTIPQTQQKVIATKMKIEQPLQTQNAEDDEQSRESTPASPPYPRPGNGLMAKLPPDHEDLEWLVGEGDDPAVFSHTVFDKDGKAEKRVENGAPATSIRH